MKEISLKLCKSSGIERKNLVIHKAVIAGWTGRDKEAVEAHIVELEELGVLRPETVPTYYQVASANLTTDRTIEVAGGESSGEVEFVILKAFDDLWVSVGSDHTDRHLETHDVTLSKQVCAKPMSDTFWLLSEVIEHWDDLELLSHIVEDSQSVIYQKGKVTAMLDPRELISLYKEFTGHDMEEGMVMFGGTLAAQGGIRASTKFEFQLYDPVLGRCINHDYEAIEI